MDDVGDAHRRQLFAAVADESLERGIGALQPAVLGDADPEPSGLEHSLESIHCCGGIAARAVDLGEEDPQAKDDESSHGAVDRHRCAPVCAAGAGEVLDGKRGRHRQESNADEAKPSQWRGLDVSRRPSAPPLGRMDAGRSDQDVRGEPGGVRPGLSGRGGTERRDVVDDVGDEDEDERGGRQPDHRRAALTMEEQCCQQAEEEDVTRRVRDARERRPAPPLVQRRLEHDRPEHEQRGKRDDGDVDEVTPVDLADTGPEQQPQADGEQRVAGHVQHVRRRRVRIPTRHVDHVPDNVSDRPAHLARRNQQPGQPGARRRQCSADRQRGRGENRDRRIERPEDGGSVIQQHVDRYPGGPEDEHRPVPISGVHEPGRSLTYSQWWKTRDACPENRPPGREIESPPSRRRSRCGSHPEHASARSRGSRRPA